MTLYKFKKEKRTFIHGDWYYPNKVYDIDRKPSVDFEEVNSKKKIEKENTEKTDIRKRLLKFKMPILREIGNEFDASDTKKSELVDEIIENASEEDIIKKIKEVNE